MSVRFSCDASKPIAELDRLAKGPDPMRFESALTSGLATADAKVHVLTGRLRESGHALSEYDDGRWTGTISFARHPGIFELARGDSPTMNHPEGGHFFLNPGGDEFVKGVYDALDDYVSGGF
jgi:hypothetical protein